MPDSLSPEYDMPQGPSSRAKTPLLEKCRAWIKKHRQQSFMNKVAEAAEAGASAKRLRVLVLGIYLADHPNHAAHLVARLGESAHHQVDQIWAGIGTQEPDPAVAAVTRMRIDGKVPKFIVLNRMLQQVDLSVYDHVIVTDDDITLPRNFTDAYLSWVEKYGLSIAQPARARHSYNIHHFVLQRQMIKLRETRFVEIGPVFSFDRRAIASLLPFDEDSPMGWGYDYVWPAIADQAGLKMGIVDATAVDHSWRPQAKTYDRGNNEKLMASYLETRPHMKRRDAMIVTRRHYR
jgi:hypothetical protein